MGKLGKIALVGCASCFGLAFVAAIVAAISLGIFANKLAAGVKQVASGYQSASQANCLLSQREASDFFGTPADVPVLLLAPSVGCSYSPSDSSSQRVVLLGVHRAKAGQSPEQLLNGALADPAYGFGPKDQMQPIPSLGSEAACIELAAGTSHLYFIKGNAVVVVTATGGIDCAAAAKFARKAATKL